MVGGVGRSLGRLDVHFLSFTPIIASYKAYSTQKSSCVLVVVGGCCVNVSLSLNHACQFYFLFKALTDCAKIKLLVGKLKIFLFQREMVMVVCGFSRVLTEEYEKNLKPRNQVSEKVS